MTAPAVRSVIGRGEFQPLLMPGADRVLMHRAAGFSHAVGHPVELLRRRVRAAQIRDVHLLSTCTARGSIMSKITRPGRDYAKNRGVLLDAAEQLMLEEGYVAVISPITPNASSRNRIRR